MYLENVSLLRFLRGSAEYGALVGNIDTVYPRSRSAILPMLGRRLRITTGLMEMTCLSRDLRIRCAALWPVADGIDLRIGAAMNYAAIGRERLLEEIRSFFETLLRQHPPYWLAWPNLIDNVAS